LRVVSVKDWSTCLLLTAMFAFVAFTVWGLGRMLQSLFD
jgi:hypothetical protein